MVCIYVYLIFNVFIFSLLPNFRKIVFLFIDTTRNWL